MYVRTGKEHWTRCSQAPHKVQGEISTKIWRKIQRITAGEISGHDCPCHSERKYTCRNAHFDHGAGNSWLLEDPAGRGGIWCNAWLWRTYKSDAEMSGRKGAHLRDRCRSGRICKDKKTSGRTGIWGGYFNNPSSELLYYRWDCKRSWGIWFYFGWSGCVFHADWQPEERIFFQSGRTSGSATKSGKRDQCSRETGYNFKRRTCRDVIWKFGWAVLWRTGKGNHRRNPERTPDWYYDKATSGDRTDLVFPSGK